MNHSITRAVTCTMLLSLFPLAVHANSELLAATLYNEAIDQASVNAAAGDESRSEALVRIVEKRRTEHLLRRFGIARDAATMMQYLQQRYPDYFADGTVDLETANHVSLRDGLVAVTAGGQSVDEVYARVAHVVPTLEDWRAIAGETSADYLASLNRLIERSAEERDAERLLLLKPAYEKERIREAVCELDEVRAKITAATAHMKPGENQDDARMKKLRNDTALGHCWLAAANWLREHTRDNLVIVDRSLAPAEQMLYAPDSIEDAFRKALK